MSGESRRPASKAEAVEQFRTSTILEAAMRVISRKGTEGATMGDVATEAGVSRPTLYLYFKDRETLVERTALLAIEQLTAELDAALARETTFEAQLRALVLAKLSFFHRHRDFFRVYQEACAGGAPPAARHRVHRERHLARLATLLKAAMKRGEVRAMDAERLALVVAETVTAILRLRLTEASSPDPAAEADWITAALLRGITSEARRT
jgi:AcrR family transcriptional regulator